MIGSRVIKVVRGNDKDFMVKVSVRGIPLNLTDVDIFCEVKDRPSGNLLFTAILNKTDPANGTFTVRFPKEQTQNLPPNQRFYFDFRFVFPDGTEKNFPSPPFEGIVVDRVTD